MKLFITYDFIFHLDPLGLTDNFTLQIQIKCLKSINSSTFQILLINTASQLGMLMMTAVDVSESMYALVLWRD